MHLPVELLHAICSFIPRPPDGQHTLASFVLVNHEWYSAGIERLYHSPWITGRNYDTFVRTICPSINAHIKRSDLAELIRVLDFSSLVYSGSKSLNARVLGRVKERIEIFIAPAATFGLLAFSALSKCRSLRTLNLEFVLDRIDLLQLFHAIGRLESLEKLYLRSCGAPRNWQELKKRPHCRYPPRLRHLAISGLCDSEAASFMCDGMGSSPVTSLHVPTLPFNGAAQLYSRHTMAANLLSLELSTRSPSLGFDTKHVLEQCPILKCLTIALWNLDEEFFLNSGAIKPTHPLTTLTITGPGGHEEDVLWHPDNLIDAMRQGGLSKLRNLFMDGPVILHWFIFQSEDWEDEVSSESMSEWLEDIVDLMDDLEDAEARMHGPNYKRQEPVVRFEEL